MEDYLRSLITRIEWLVRKSLADRERNHVHPGYRSLPECSHVIFYIVSDEYVDIIGIPHKSMDIGSGIFGGVERDRGHNSGNNFRRTRPDVGGRARTGNLV